jgi:hypothetical protein
LRIFTDFTVIGKGRRQERLKLVTTYGETLRGAAVLMGERGKTEAMVWKIPLSGVLLEEVPHLFRRTPLVQVDKCLKMA